MKKTILIFIISVFHVYINAQTSDNYDLLDDDFINSYAAYSKLEEKRITIYDTQEYGYFNIRSNTSTNHEYLLIKNSTDSTFIFFVENAKFYIWRLYK